MLTTLKDVLDRARSGGYAVAAFDTVVDVFTRTILETAQSCGAPVVMMCLKQDLQSDDWTYLPAMVRAGAEWIDVPVVLHLDHAVEIAQVRRAVDAGFTSVMIDGSNLPFEQNVALTGEAVEIAAAHGVSVEAELGYVGGMDLDDVDCYENVLTEPEEVARFVEQTGVDALAVSIGTAHGVYRSLPELNIERLDMLNQVSPVPLVMHGGSGTPDDQIREAVRHGICKMNIYADCRIAMARALKQAATTITRKDPLPHDVFGVFHSEIASVVREKIELLGAAGEAVRQDGHCGNGFSD